MNRDQPLGATFALLCIMFYLTYDRVKTENYNAGYMRVLKSNIEDTKAEIKKSDDYWAKRQGIPLREDEK